MMEKADLKSGEVIARDFESTNSNELFSKMKATALESLAKFQRQGSNWRLCQF